MKLSTFGLTGSNSRATLSSSRRVGLLLFVIVAAEFAVLSAGYDLGAWPVNKGDEPGYQLLATNLLDHGVLSLSEQEPFEPSVLRSPAYPLFVASVYWVSGHSVVFLRLIQFGLLWLTGVLLVGLASQFVSRNAGIISGILCVTYVPLVFHAAYHLTETLATLLTVSFVYLLVLMAKHERYGPLAASGVGAAGALVALVRPSLSLLAIVPIIICANWIFRGARFQRVAILMTLVSLGYLSLIVPCVVRNMYVTRSFVPLATAGGWSFYYSMNQYSGTATYRVPVDEWRRAIEDYELRRANALETLSETPGPRGASNAALADLLVDQGFARDGSAIFHALPITHLIAGIPLRLLYLWSTCDPSPWAASGPFHRIVQSFHIALAMLALAGGYMMRRRFIALWPLWIIPLHLIAIHIVFHVEPRYSLPGRPFLLVYAGFSIERAVFLLRSRMGRLRAAFPGDSSEASL